MASPRRRRATPVPRVKLSRRDEIFPNDGLCRGGSRLVRAPPGVLSVLLEPCDDADPKSFELGEPADQDGCASQLFDYLWARDPRTGRACPGVRLPHTIVFKHGQPRSWYFFSEKDDEMKRKRQFNLTSRNIHETIMRAAGVRAESQVQTCGPCHVCVRVDDGSR